MCVYYCKKKIYCIGMQLHLPCIIFRNVKRKLFDYLFICLISPYYYWIYRKRKKKGKYSTLPTEKKESSWKRILILFIKMNKLK